jgi:hypothetical protein
MRAECCFPEISAIRYTVRAEPVEAFVSHYSVGSTSLQGSL